MNNNHDTKQVSELETVAMADVLLSNLTLSNASTDYQGLFGKLDGATVQNLNVVTTGITGGSYTGILAGHSNNSTITNVHVRGTNASVTIP